MSRPRHRPSGEADGDAVAADRAGADQPQHGQQVALPSELALKNGLRGRKKAEQCAALRPVLNGRNSLDLERLAWRQRR
jgi:hypothetical protein